MKMLKTALKNIFKWIGFALLILLHLFFIYWIDVFRNLGSNFPYLFIFLLPALLLAWRSHGSLKRIILVKSIPLAAAILIYWIYLTVFAGLMRSMGWVWDMWLFILLYFVATLGMLYMGWFLKSRSGIFCKWALPAFTILLIFLSLLQFYLPNYSKYYYLWDGIQGAFGIFPLSLEDKSNQDAFEILCSYIEHHYPYFEYKNIDWKQIKQKAESELKANEDFHKVIIGMLSYLQDGHVRSYIPLRNSRQRYKEYVYFGTGSVSIEGKWIIRGITPDSLADKVGLKPGMELSKIEGKSINEALESVPDYLIYAKSKSIYGQRFRDSKRLAYLLNRPLGTKISLSYINLSGEEITSEVKFVKTKRKYTPQEPVSYKRLPEGYGYIKMRLWTVDPIIFVPTFDKILTKLWDTKALIFDIRGNPGGAIVLTDQILGRFTNHKVNYGGILNSKGDFAPLYVVPRRPIYSHPVVLLIDDRCASASSYFAYAASHLNNITLVGRATMGVVSSPSKVAKLPRGIMVNLVSCGLTNPKGNYVVEWTGVQPDVHVPYNISDMRSRIDRDLLTAIEILQNRCKD